MIQPANVFTAFAFTLIFARCERTIIESESQKRRNGLCSVSDLPVHCHLRVIRLHADVNWCVFQVKCYCCVSKELSFGANWCFWSDYFAAVQLFKRLLSDPPLVWPVCHSMSVVEYDLMLTQARIGMVCIPLFFCSLCSRKEISFLIVGNIVNPIETIALSKNVLFLFVGFRRQMKVEIWFKRWGILSLVARRGTLLV